MLIRMLFIRISLGLGGKYFRAVVVLRLVIAYIFPPFFKYI